MSKELEDKRKEEIIEACAKLYETQSFKEISIKDIAEITTFSRPSIYNYFQTKEEIFLELFKREYISWIADLEKIINENENLSINEFSNIFAKTIKDRRRLLKLLSMNMYDIEENSRKELLVEFKKQYGKSLKITKECLNKFFKNMTEDEKNDFIYSFFPFMYGIYPYTTITEKQKEAMEIAKCEFKQSTIYDLTYKTVKKLLEEKQVSK